MRRDTKEVKKCTPDHVITHCMGIDFPEKLMKEYQCSGLMQRLKGMLTAIQGFEVEVDHYPPNIEAQYDQLRSEIPVLQFLHSL